MAQPETRAPGHVGPHPPSSIFSLLARVSEECEAVGYHGWIFTLNGRGPSGEQMVLPCPKLPPDVKEDSLAGNLLDALDEAEEPPTLRDWSFSATGKAPNGAVKRCARKLVQSGLARELPTTPKTYERVR